MTTQLIRDIPVMVSAVILITSFPGFFTNKVNISKRLARQADDHGSAIFLIQRYE